MRINITREVSIPDRLKIERYRRSPELGPKVLFFSGGTALREVSRKLIEYTHNSIHVITPFDSGGSSAVLRRAFGMPAVGDIRNRLMALADQSVKGNPEIRDLFAHRLDKTGGPGDSRGELESMAEGGHPLVAAVPDPMRKIVRNHFFQFLDAAAPDFDYRGASIGNVVLTAGYLTNRCQLDPVIFLFSKLAEVRGVVRPVVSTNLHLAVELDDGQVIVGQHRFTGKECAAPDAPIRHIWLAADLDDPAPVEIPIRDKMARLIGEAGLICYPVGSFWSSLVANLLPSGVGRAVAANRCPKVFVPNTGPDPEALGLSVAEQARVIRRVLARDGADPDQVLQYVLVDSARGAYPGGLDLDELAAEGLTAIDCPLVASNASECTDAPKCTKAGDDTLNKVPPRQGPFIDANLAADALLSLA